MSTKFVFWGIGLGASIRSIFFTRVSIVIFFTKIATIVIVDINSKQKISSMVIVVFFITFSIKK